MPQESSHPRENAPASGSRESERWVSWVSIRPQSGELDFYPKDVAERLEHAYAIGDVSIDLGTVFLAAHVSFFPDMLQRSVDETRDVRRVELASAEAPVTMCVVQVGDWRAAETPSTAGAKEVTVAPATGSTVPRAKTQSDPKCVVDLSDYCQVPPMLTTKTEVFEDLSCIPTSFPLLESVTATTAAGASMIFDDISRFGS
jgi:hypothetical protein